MVGYELFLLCFYHRVKQNHIALLSRRKIVRRPFRDVTDGARPERDPSPVDAQTTAASEHVADHVLVSVADPFWIGILSRFERDEAGAKALPLRAIYIADFLIDLFQVPQGFPDLDDFHLIAFSFQPSAFSRKS